MTALNYFSLLELPVAVDVDRAVLDRHYRQQQLAWHPDRFVAAPEAERLQALQRTSLLNDAYDTLKTPLRRAEHLLAVMSPPGADNVKLPVAFLEQQLALREALEDLVPSRDHSKLAELQGVIDAAAAVHWQELRSNVEANDWRAAQLTLQKLQFVLKLNDDIANLEERWLDS